jgi:hypothetical protein
MRLVTAEGESILAAYDDYGIKELRRHKMIWRSWGQEQRLPSEDHFMITDIHGIRRIESDPIKLRLFFLSLLWRAAETNLHEFHEIEIPAEHRQQLAETLISGNAPDPDFYPIMLTQLSTRGPPHNMTAVAQEKPIPLLGKDLSAPIFRFYFDGLVAHFHRDLPGSTAAGLGPLILGNEENIVLNTVTFEGSWQFENLRTVEFESELEFPGEIARILGE